MDGPELEVQTKKLPILHVLRNPYGFTEEEIRDCRIALCELYEQQKSQINRAEGVIAKTLKILKGTED